MPCGVPRYAQGQGHSGVRSIASDGGCLKEIRPATCGVDASLKSWRAVVVRDIGEPPPKRIRAEAIPADFQATLFCSGDKSSLNEGNR